MIQLRKLIRPLYVLGGLIILSVIVILYLYFKYNITQVYYSPTKKYKIEKGWRSSSPAGSLDNIYRLVDVGKNKLIWEGNYESSNIEYIKWKDEILCLYFLSYENISMIKFNLETGEKQSLDSAEWEQAIGEW